MKLLQAYSPNQHDVLNTEIEDYKRVIKRKGKLLFSDDTLDLGMCFWTTHWFVETEEWAAELQKRAAKRLDGLVAMGKHQLGHILYRLTFRDFGVCLGIKCAQKADLRLKEETKDLVLKWEQVLIETPIELRPNTEVMHAAALIPGAFQKGYLGPEKILEF